MSENNDSTSEKASYFKNIRSILAKNITPGAKVVLIYFFDRTGKNENCWPSLTTICKDTALARPSVVRAIKELARKGLIEVECPANPAVGNTNKYKTITGKESLPEPVKNLNPNDINNGTMNGSCPLPSTNVLGPFPKGVAGDLFLAFYNAYPKGNHTPFTVRDWEKAKGRWDKIGPTPAKAMLIMDILEKKKKSSRWNHEDCGSQFIDSPYKFLGEFL